MDWRDIPGFFDFEDIYRKVVAEAKDGDHIVEIGVMFGKSTAFMAQEIITSKKHIVFDAIDTWGWCLKDAFTAAPSSSAAAHIIKKCSDIREAVEKLLQGSGVAQNVNLISGSGQQRASDYQDGSLSFVFIDTTHLFLDTVELLIAYLPKIRAGGMIAGHDYDLAGVHDAVAAILGPVQTSGKSFFQKIR